MAVVHTQRDFAVDDIAGNLTQFELLALNSSLNLADGHARQELTPNQGRIIDELPQLWAASAKRPVEEVERDARQAYFQLVGQHSYPTAEGRVLSCYSSSVAMEIFARALATWTDSIALLHPTFDNIPDILRGVGLTLVPLEEDRLHDEDLTAELLSSVGALFVTTPNNPTGRALSEARLRSLARQCADGDVVLALDTSFRGFEPAAQYDYYTVLESSGCRWVVIEDTGKLWPTLELKIGWLAFAEHVALPITKVHSDILLGVSPLILALVEQFSLDAARGGLAELHRFIAENRRIVRDGLADVPDVSFPDPESHASVERIHVGARSSVRAWTALRELRVFALPCQQFHWAEPSRGDHTLRLALSRSAASVSAAAETLRSVLLRDQ
jgi:enduracididine biosynthesis enzyme MppP